MTLTSYADGRAAIWAGNCLHLLAALADNSVDSIVTDPPYGLGFMGKKWDALPPGADWAAECLRVLKPGGHLLAFGGSRTWHRLAVAIEDGGFELRDSIAWLYGSGFPKSLDVSKAIDKAAGVDREVVGSQPDRWTGKGDVLNFATDRPQDEIPVTGGPATPAAVRWEGWGTALKPGFEPIVVARKPFPGTVAANVLEHGTGALNVAACRIAVEDDDYARNHSGDRGHSGTRESGQDTSLKPGGGSASDGGRWPANVVLDEDQAAELDQQSGVLTSGANPTRRGSDKFRDAYGDFKGQEACTPARGKDTGGASRFFYCAKAPNKERPSYVKPDGTKVTHNTVKPLTLMRWLARLVTPPGGLLLDTFAGSGTTGEAALIEGFRFLGAENDPDHLPLIAIRLDRVTPVQEEASA